MTSGQSLFAHWYYHVPNLILAALMYLLIARLALSLLLGRGSDNRLARLIGVATNPVLVGVGAVTPRVVPVELVMMFAVIWLLALRLALFMGVAATGARLAMG